MRIHFFRHDPVEGIGTFQDIASTRDWSLSDTNWDRGETPPSLDDWDMLAVMGGPMNIHEHDRHPWLLEEKAYLDRAIAKNKRIVGVCLGAQLLADRLGGRVTRNPHSEIGWSELHVNEALRGPGGLFEGFENPAKVFQWHGDTFSLPPGAVAVGRTEACQNQGFVKGSVLGMQFHLELSPENLRDLVASHDRFEGPYVQKPEAFLADLDGFRQNTERLADILDRIAAGALGS
jgi:GMP synthase (glutamine-hydrolysing)